MIPVTYIHFGDIPEYLILSIKQALKFNNKVVLITDGLILIPGVEIVSCELYKTGVEDFEKAYVHMSKNSADFEKICIKRWIILSNYIMQNNIEVCYYSDSDVMLYANVNDLYVNYQSFDAVYTLPEYQDNYRWTASGCCSFWKQDTLIKFLNYIFKLYSSEEIIVLKEKWNYHQTNDVAGGVCDMTLLYLFSKTINFFSLSHIMLDFAFDQNYIDSENYFKNEYEVVYDNIAEKKVKKIEFIDELPYAYNLINKKTIRFIAITEFARYVNLNNSIKIKTRVYRFIKRYEEKIRNFFNKENQHGWFGNYTNWEEAEKECSGYDSDVILDKVKSSVLKVRNKEAVYERDSVLFDAIQYSKPLISAFKDSISNNQLHIVDFGGSLGSSYFQNKNLFTDNIDLRWSVVEQQHFVDCGKKEIEIDNLKFYHTIDESLKYQSNQVLLLSSVIPYFKEPYQLITDVLRYNFEYIIIDRTAFLENTKERITKQIVPEFIYKASYPAWFLNEQKFINAFKNKYDLVFDFMSAFDPIDVLEDGVKVYRKGFYFKKKKDA